MSTEILLGASGIGLIVGLVQIAKKSGLPDKHAPLAALILGVILLTGYKLQYGAAADPWFDTIFYGLGLGFAASGAYSTVITATQGAAVIREKVADANDVLVVPKGTVAAAQAAGQPVVVADLPDAAVDLKN